MIIRYFCQRHAKQMLVSERQAFFRWMQMMQKGCHAYMHCQHDSARIYLGAAIDIAMLRLTSKSNSLFLLTHATKPAEFLLNVLVTESAFEDAKTTLDCLSTLLPRNDLAEDELLNDFINEYQEFVDQGEAAALQKHVDQVVWLADVRSSAAKNSL